MQQHVDGLLANFHADSVQANSMHINYITWITDNYENTTAIQPVIFVKLTDLYSAGLTYAGEMAKAVCYDSERHALPLKTRYACMQQSPRSEPHPWHNVCLSVFAPL